MKRRAPGAKLQAPSSKLQRSTKQSSVYPEVNDALPVVAEDGEAGKHPFDLEERTAEFGEAVVRFAKKISRSPAHDRLIDQLVGCGTSIGANYCEANEGVSKKDFHAIIGRCKKESKETKYFLRMIAAAEPSLSPAARTLYREATELHLIFCAMYRNTH